MFRIFRAKPLASLPGSNPKGPTRPVRRGPLTLLIAPAALLATLAFACDDDETKVTDGNGGSGGGGGTAGSGGGSSGSAGTGGSAGTAGSAGTGGGAGTAGTGGSGGTGGTAGTAGTGGTGDPPDGGADAEAPDSGEVLSPRQITATAICARLDEIDSCAAPASTCRDDVVTQWEGAISDAQANCEATVDAYFNCQAAEPVTSYDCNGGPEFTVPASGGCGDEETAFFDAFSNPCP